MKTWDERANAVIAQGCTTYSRRSDQFIKGVYPSHAVKSHNSTEILAENGKSYVDFICGLGSNLLSVNNNFSLPYTGEVLLAEELVKLFPCIDKIKILKTGSEACQAAVRIARAYKENTTHKDKEIEGLGHGYHGWHNYCIAEEDPGMGTYWEGYFKKSSIAEIIKAIEEDPDDSGYVIIEPVQIKLDATVIQELQKLRELCTQHEIVLIFDEVITGFRTPNYCISNFVGVQPDLIVLGKAMGNGYPVAVVGGAAKFMDTAGYFISSTFASESFGIDQCLNTLKQLSEPKLQELWDLGSYFQKEMNLLLSPIRLCMKGIGSRAIFDGDEDTLNIFWQESVKKGLLFGKSWFLNMSHTKHVLDKVIAMCRETVEDIQDGGIKLEGSPRKEVFRRV